MDGREVLFRVLKPETGHEYVIYTDGTVEGFGDGATAIFNYHPSLLSTHTVQAASDVSHRELLLLALEKIERRTPEDVRAAATILTAAADILERRPSRPSITALGCSLRIPASRPLAR